MAFSYRNYTESDEVKKARERVQQTEANKPKAWNGGTYGQTLNNILDKINNREKFSYDLNGDALYNQYKQQYMKQGKLAMLDTMGQASALTGGYGSSYAESVGNQAYQSYLTQLNDVVPTLYQLAYDRYNQETSDLYNQYSATSSAYNTEYGQYRDTVSDWQSDRSYYGDAYNNERSWDYGLYSDAYDRALKEYQLNSSGSGGGGGYRKKGSGDGDDSTVDTVALNKAKEQAQSQIAAKLSTGSYTKQSDVQRLVKEVLNAVSSGMNTATRDKLNEQVAKAYKLY